MSDPVNHPKHYTSHPSGVEAIEVCEQLSFCLGNAVKYLFRAGLKDPVLQDLQKAVWYLRRYQKTCGNGAYLQCTRHIASVMRAEPKGSVLGDVLEILISEADNLPLAIARVEREVERVQEKR